VGGRSVERGNEIVQKLVKQELRSSFMQIDVRDRTSLLKAASATHHLGGIDILVNAAGVNSRTPFLDMDDSEWNALLDTNLGAVFRSCQIFVPQMKGRPSGASIINISSASSGPPISRVFGYAAAKAGVNNLTQYLAREFAPDGIRVNAIIPGFFPAEQNRALLTNERITSIIGHTPMGRLGNSDEINGTLLWLASARASSFVTGALVHVDGGFSAMTI
jgi:NAD(P)-dependent dehydrogenase (short-subunit alcohol dehydrogenase family)